MEQRAVSLRRESPSDFKTSGFLFQVRPSNPGVQGTLQKSYFTRKTC